MRRAHRAHRNSRPHLRRPAVSRYPRKGGLGGKPRFPSEAFTGASTLAGGTLASVKLVFDAEPIHAVAKCPERDAEHFRGRGAVVVGSLERVQNGLALDRIEPLLQGQSTLVGALRRPAP